MVGACWSNANSVAFQVEFWVSPAPPWTLCHRRPDQKRVEMCWKKHVSTSKPQSSEAYHHFIVNSSIEMATNTVSMRLRANALINHWCGVFFWVMAQTWSACWDPRISHIFSVFNQMGFNLFWANPAWLLPSGNQTLQWKVLYTGGFWRISIQML